MSVVSSSLIVSLVDRVSAPARDIAKNINGINQAASGNGFAGFSERMGIAQQNLGRAIEQNNRALANARMGLVDAVAGFYLLRGAIMGPVTAAMRFESAMADVRKVVDFETPDSYRDFQKGLIGLSREVPITVNGLAAIAAAAGQAGIAGDDLVKFTEAASKVSTAFDISANDAGSALAKLKTALGMNIDETVLLTDSINHLSNSQASSASEVLDMVYRSAAVGTQFGFTAQETAALGSAMIAAGAQSQVASTSFLNMGRALTRGASATKRQRDAFKELGLDATDVAKRMQEDATGTLMDVFERLGELPKEIQASVSSDLFGNEARALGPLITNLDLVRESLGLVADENEYAGSSFREFEIRAQTFENKLEVLKNKLTAVSVQIGNALIPALSQLVDIIGPVIDKVGELAAEHPQLIAGLIAATAGLIGFRVALAGLRFVGLLGKGGALSLLSVGLKGVAAAGTPVAGFLETLEMRAGLAAKSTGKMPGPLARMGDALLLLGGGPKAALRGILTLLRRFGLIGLAVGGAIKFVVDNFDGFKAMLSGFADGFMKEFDWSAFEELQSTMGQIFGPIGDALKPVTDAMGTIMGFILGDSMDIGASEAEWKSWGETIGGSVANGVNAVVGGITKLIEGVKSAWDAITNLGSAIASLWGANAEAPPPSSGGAANLGGGGGWGDSGHRATGGSVWPGSSFLVGDGGEEEVFTPRTGGTITPLSKLGSGPVTIGPFNITGNDPIEIANQVRTVLSDEIDRILRGSHADMEARG